MKIGRRCFLSLGIGALTGITVSPLPWKLMDDISIWTQNWPWTPVPSKGKVSYVNSTCALCPGRCGITARKIDNNLVKIEGMKKHPVNDGGICLLGLAGSQLLYSPLRVKSPLKRAGEKGKGKWQKISWDDAIAEVTKRLGELRSKGESHTVASISGSELGSLPELLKRLLTAYGSPNFMCMSSIWDNYELTINLMSGVKGLAGFDFESSDYVLSFGSGIVDGWGSSVHMFQANSKWRKKNVKVVQIEPRLSNTAAKSSEWIPVKPGTEGILALGIAYIIIWKSIYNKDFIDNYSVGFNNWKNFVLAEFNPDNVSKLTGVDKAVIDRLANEFANAKRPVAICGRGQGNRAGSLNDFMAVYALNGLVGNINQKGGVWIVPKPSYINWPKVKQDNLAAKGTGKERIDGAGSGKYAMTNHLLSRVPEIINSDKKYPIKALFVLNANPYYTMPNSDAAKKAFDKIPFVVSFSSYMDETSENADLILPNHNYLERYEDILATSGLKNSVIGLSRPVVDPQFDTMHTGDVIIRIAKEMGNSIADSFPWDSYASCLEETFGDKWENLNKNGYLIDEYEKNPQGKFTFSNEDIAALPSLAMIEPEGDDKTYPLILIPYDSMRLANGSIGNPPFATKTVEDTVLKEKDIFIEINPKTAKSFGLTEGKSANLSTPKGSVKVKIHLFDGIMPGLLAMPRGLGHFNNDRYLTGKGVNFNQLIGPVEDPASGHDAAWGIRARLAKV